MIKSLKILSCCFLILVACACETQSTQSTKKEQTMAVAATEISLQDITSENIVEVISANVQRYKWEPLYYLRIGKANCMIEVLVNDMPVYKSYSLSNLASPLEINHKILKTGTHTVTVRMYPVGDLIKEAYDYGETVTHLGDASSVYVKVVRYNNQGDMSFDDEFEVKNHQSPTKDADGEIFAGSGLTYFEYSFEFHADVPYDLSENSWGNAADLREVKPAYLEKETFNYYQTFLREFKKRNKDYIAKLYFETLLVQAQTYYKTEGGIKAGWDEELELLNNPTIEPQPITNYELVFYARGRVCYLRLKTKEDLFYRNKCAGWVKYTEDGLEYGTFFGLYLYCPKHGFSKRGFKLRKA
ncbi:MAG: hypothetical protein JKY08_06075 [Flavobacteriaceae bacterium]|nr:hypothetical protein [Flavobacteriaceae bacterium]